MNDKVKIALGGSLLILFFATGYLGFIADTARKADVADAKKQLEDGIAENEAMHTVTHKELKKIVVILSKAERAALKKVAQESIRTIKDAPADSEDYRRALHGASDWAHSYAFATGKQLRAPNAKDGGKAVADFYTARLNELSSE